jgi:CRISPR-associated protein Cmr2
MKSCWSAIATGIAWCLAWGDKRKPQFDISVLQEMRRALNSGEEVPENVREIVDRVQELLAIPEKISREEFPETITDLQNKYPNLWNQPGKIGLVYGGVTKVKQYVFEDAKLPDIRGASALLDRINLVDLPAFFDKRPESQRYNIYLPRVGDWLNDSFPGEPKLSEALIPEMIVYSTGGNILAFCPAAFVNELADAIEKRYSYVTLTANSCAVGDKFKLLEIRFGLLRDAIEQTFWLDRYRQEYKNPVVEAYFGKLDKDSNEPADPSCVEEAFANRKSFNELTTKLAVMFNQRRSGNDFKINQPRSGNDFENRPSRRYPPMGDRLSLGLPTIPTIPMKKVFRAILGFLRFLRANAKRAIGLSRENPRKLIGTQNGILLSLKVGCTSLRISWTSIAKNFRNTGATTSLKTLK